MQEALSLMGRDVGEAPAFALVLLFPLLLSLPSIWRGSRLAWVAPLVLAGQLGAWYEYYASNAPNGGLQTGMEIAVGGWLIGMLASSLAIFLTVRRPRGAHLLGAAS